MTERSGDAVAEVLERTDASHPQVVDEAYHIGLAWYTLVIFELQLIASGIDIAIVTLLVHPIEAAFRINDVGFAAITAIPIAIGIAVVNYPAGVLADTFRRRNLIAAGAVIWALAALIAARADSGTMLFLARLLAAIGTAIPGPAVFSMLSDAFPRTRRAFAISIYSAGGAIGGGLGLTICGALVEATQRIGVFRISGVLFSPWQQCFVAVAAIGFIVLALVLTVPEPLRRDRSRLAYSNLKSTLAYASLKSTLRIYGQYLRRHGLLWALLLFGAAVGVTSLVGIGTWGPTFGMRHYGATGVASIALLGVFGTAGSLLGSIGGGLLAQRGINHKDSRVVPRILIACTLIACVSAVGFPFMPSWLLAVVGMGLVRAAGVTIGVLLSVATQETAPNEVRGQLVGTYGFIAFFPSAVGATLVAFLASSVFAKVGGLGPALAAVGCITGVLAVLPFIFAAGPYERARHEMRALATTGLPH